jgi:hypothetical protein
VKNIGAIESMGASCLDAGKNCFALSDLSVGHGGTSFILAQQKVGKSINDLPTLKGLKSYRKGGLDTASRSISHQIPVRKGQVAYKAEGKR